jgi:hypothetical protein
VILPENVMLDKEEMMPAHRIKAERRMRSRTGKNMVLLPADDEEEGEMRQGKAVHVENVRKVFKVI